MSIQPLKKHSFAPAEVRAFLARLHWSPCDRRHDSDALQALAAALLPGPVASASAMAAVHAKTGASLFLWREDKQGIGFIAFFILSSVGAEAAAAGRLSGAALDLAFVSPPNMPAQAGYLWALGGTAPPAQLAAVRAVRALRREVFSGIEVYARAATPKGARFAEAEGFASAASGLVRQSPPLDTKRFVLDVAPTSGAAR